MIDLVIIGLLQALAGPPAPAPDAQAPSASQAPAEASPETPQAEAAPAPAPAPQMRRERVCREIEITGRRMPQRVCRTVMVPVETPPAPQETPQ